MAVLFLVGEGRETPEIVTQLLDVEKNPGKPNYHMAAEEPLVLHASAFDNLSFEWTPKTLWGLTEHYERIYEQYSVAAAQALNSLRFVKSCNVRVSDAVHFAKMCNLSSGGLLSDHLKRDEDVQTESNAKQGEGRKNNAMMCDADKAEHGKDEEKEESDVTPPAKRLRIEPRKLFVHSKQAFVGWGQVLQVLDEKCQLAYPYPTTGAVQNASKKMPLNPGMYLFVTYALFYMYIMGVVPSCCLIVC